VVSYLKQFKGEGENREGNWVGGGLAVSYGLTYPGRRPNKRGGGKGSGRGRGTRFLRWLSKFKHLGRGSRTSRDTL